METLIDYIKREYGGSRIRFAEANNVKKQQVYKWIVANFIVVDGVLYSPRRELNTKT